MRQDGCSARLSGEQLQDADAVCPPRMRCVACGKERVSVAYWGSVGVWWAAASKGAALLIYAKRQ